MLQIVSQLLLRYPFRDRQADFITHPVDIGKTEEIGRLFKTLVHITQGLLFLELLLLQPLKVQCEQAYQVTGLTKAVLPVQFVRLFSELVYYKGRQMGPELKGKVIRIGDCSNGDIALGHNIRKQVFYCLFFVRENTVHLVDDILGVLLQGKVAA